MVETERDKKTDIWQQRDNSKETNSRQDTGRQLALVK